MSVFQKLSDFVVETSEQALKIFEEGSAILMSGDSPNNNDGGSTGGFNGKTDAQDNSNFIDELPDDYLESDSPLNGLAENVLSDIMKNQSAPTSTWDNIQAFKSAIAWSEPFIISIILFHFALIICTILATKRSSLTGRSILMGTIFIIVRFAEKLNAYGSENWEQFASQNYFDKQGVFVSLMISAPLLFISACMLVAIVREASSLLIQVKTREFKAKAKQGGKRRKKTKKQD